MNIWNNIESNKLGVTNRNFHFNWKNLEWLESQRHCWVFTSVCKRRKSVMYGLWSKINNTMKWLEKETTVAVTVLWPTVHWPCHLKWDLNSFYSSSSSYFVSLSSLFSSFHYHLLALLFSLVFSFFYLSLVSLLSFSIFFFLSPLSTLFMSFFVLLSFIFLTVRRDEDYVLKGENSRHTISRDWHVWRFMLGRQKRVSFQTSHKTQKKERLLLIHSDVRGSMTVSSIDEKHHVVTFIDDHSWKV